MITMEPINLVTGLPGAGKTLFGVWLLGKCKEEGLRCYNYNVKGLDPDIAEPWAGPIERWGELPPGSVLIVDEAHSIFPNRPTNAQVPDHIRALAEIRHKGIRLICIDQTPDTLDKFIRRRVGAHYHLVNRTGHDMARLFSNRGVVEDPKRAGAWGTGESELWRYPKELFGRYSSASVHMKKRRIPRKLLLLIGASVLVLVMFGWVGTRLIGRMTADPVPAAVAAVDEGTDRPGFAQQIFGGHLGGDSDQGGWWRDASTFAWAHSPLVPGVPWSAPIFQDQPITTTPDLLCVRIGERRCRCYTEQMTRLDVSRSQCYAAVERGVYNPYRARSTPTPTGHPQQHQPGHAGGAPADRWQDWQPPAPGQGDDSPADERTPRYGYAAGLPVRPYQGIR